MTYIIPDKGPLGTLERKPMTEQLKRREFCVYCQKRHEIPDNLAEELAEIVSRGWQRTSMSVAKAIISHLKERGVL